MRNLFIMALVCAVLLFGCAGQTTTSGPQQGAPQGAAGTPQAPSGQPNATPSGAEPQANQTQAEPAGQSAADLFTSILGMRPTLQYKVAYDISTTVAGQEFTSQMNEFIKGTDKLRFDSAYSGIETRTYLMDNSYYSCTKQAAWACMKIAVQEQDTTKAMDDIETNTADYQITADGTMQVAGVTAACYKVTGKDLEYYRSCHSSEGVPLYIKVQSASGGQSYTTEMTATEYSTTVADSDFVLPATPTELPAVNASAGGDVCSYCGYLTGSDKDQCLASCAG